MADETRDGPGGGDSSEGGPLGRAVVTGPIRTISLEDMADSLRVGDTAAHLEKQAEREQSKRSEKKCVHRRFDPAGEQGFVLALDDEIRTVIVENPSNVVVNVFLGTDLNNGGVPYYSIPAGQGRQLPLPSGGPSSVAIARAAVAAAGTYVRVWGYNELMSYGSFSISPSSGSTSGIAYDPTILGEATLTHFWKFNDAAAALSAADSKGSTALTAHGNVFFGSRSLGLDSERSVMFGGPPALANFLDFPNGMIPAGSWTVEMVILWPAITATGTVFFSADANQNFDLYVDNGGAPPGNLKIITGGGATTTVLATLAPGVPTFIAVKWDGAATTVYVNGIQVYTGAIHPTQTGAGKLGAWAQAGAANGNAFMGGLAKLAIYSSALSAASIASHYANL